MLSSLFQSCDIKLHLLQNAVFLHPPDRTRRNHSEEAPPSANDELVRGLVELWVPADKHIGGIRVKLKGVQTIGIVDSATSTTPISWEDSVVLEKSLEIGVPAKKSKIRSQSRNDSPGPSHSNSHRDASSVGGGGSLRHHPPNDLDNSFSRLPVTAEAPDSSAPSTSSSRDGHQRPDLNHRNQSGHSENSNASGAHEEEREGGGDHSPRIRGDVSPAQRHPDRRGSLTPHGLAGAIAAAMARGRSASRKPTQGSTSNSRIGSRANSRSRPASRTTSRATSPVRTPEENANAGELQRQQAAAVTERLHREDSSHENGLRSQQAPTNSASTNRSRLFSPAPAPSGRSASAHPTVGGSSRTPGRGDQLSATSSGADLANETRRMLSIDEAGRTTGIVRNGSFEDTPLGEPVHEEQSRESNGSVGPRGRGGFGSRHSYNVTSAEDGAKSAQQRSTSVGLPLLRGRKERGTSRGRGKDLEDVPHERSSSVASTSNGNDSESMFLARGVHG